MMEVPAEPFVQRRVLHLTSCAGTAKANKKVERVSSPGAGRARWGAGQERVCRLAAVCRTVGGVGRERARISVRSARSAWWRYSSSSRSSPYSGSSGALARSVMVILWTCWCS